MKATIIVIILLFIGVAQGLLLSLALVSIRRGNMIANRILAVLLFIFSFMIFFHALGQLQPSTTRENGWFGHTVFFLFGPLLYYYAKALTQRGFHLRSSDSLHLLPCVLSCLLYLIVAQIFIPAGFIYVLNTLMLLLMMVQMCAYLFGTIIVLMRHTHSIRESFSSLEWINLRWLKFIIIGQIVIWPIAFIVEIYKSGAHEMNIVWLLVSLFMYMIGYFGIHQPEIFTKQMQEEILPDQKEKNKYEKSTLSVEQIEMIVQKLNALMQSTKPYLDNTLTLPLLAKQLSVSTHNLSQVINGRLGKNFYELINHYRVDEAKRLLKDPRYQHLNIAAIGFEAGFNSVSSFNSIFKKVTKLTPSQYLSLKADNPP